MKPIATVHWTEDGIEKSKDFNISSELETFTAILRFKNHPYIVCMTSVLVNVHFRAPKRPYKHIS